MMEKEPLLHNEEDGKISIRALFNQVQQLQSMVLYLQGELNKMMVGTAEACPHCGSGNINMHAEIDGNKTFFNVVCEQCKSQGPYYENKMEALTIWNMRRKKQ